MTPQDPTPQDTAPRRRLARHATDRKLAGVAGGLARHFDLDPTLVRIVFVVLALFGGAGIALYALIAIVAPADEGAPAMSAWAKVGLVGLGAIAILSLPFTGGPGIALLVLGALGVLVYRFFGGTVDPRVYRASVILVVCATALVAGLGAGVAAAFGAGEAMAAVVIVTGVALIAGGLRGGARWLIIPALMLALPVSVVAAADLSLEGGVGERDYRPGSVSDIRDAYELGVGELRIDLRDVDFSDVDTVALDARVGVGDLEVTVPEGVCVRTTADVGMGVTDLLGRVNEGVDVEGELAGAARPGTPTVQVDMHAGVGLLEINRTPRVGDAGFDHDRGPLVDDGCS